MRSFYDKEDYTVEDIQSLIDNQVEESIYLDFKSAGSLEKNDKKRAELSKDVASFANSDGGVIIYGIKEVDHVASEYSFIDGNEFTKEWIETIINSYIQRRISDITIYPIRVDGDIKKSIYVVKIPYSYDAPHLSKDNRYYKRYNFMSVPMEEYEIRQTYNRKEKTELIISDIIVTPGNITTLQEALQGVSIALTFQVANISNGIENQYKLEIHINEKMLRERTQSKNHMRNESGYAIFSFPCTSSLFQQEITSITTINLQLNSRNIDCLSDPITVNLYYTNGVKTRSFIFDQDILIKGRALRYWRWQ